MVITGGGRGVKNYPVKNHGYDRKAGHYGTLTIVKYTNITDIKLI